MDKQQTLKAACRTLGLTHTRDTLETILHEAEKEGTSYLDFLLYVTDGEILYKQEKAKTKRIKEAGFPYPKYLKDFDLTFCQALSRKQFKQLSELTWIDGLYNLILSGVIDEVGYLPISATEGNLFFQLISELQEKTSIIITTNKGFEEWTEFLGDAALATAILDRLSYQCDKIQMNGKSYRLENRKSFLDDTADRKRGTA